MRTAALASAFSKAFREAKKRLIRRPTRTAEAMTSASKKLCLREFVDVHPMAAASLIEDEGIAAL